MGNIIFTQKGITICVLYKNCLLLLTCFKLCQFINVILLYLPIHVAMETCHGGSGIGTILIIGIVL